MNVQHFFRKKSLFWKTKLNACGFTSFEKNNFFHVSYVSILTILTVKDWWFTQFSTETAGWLLLIFLICLHNQLSSIYSIISTNVWKMDSKNGWLLLSSSYTAKFGLVFVLTLEKAFSLEVSFSSQQKEHRLSKKQY